MDDCVFCNIIQKQVPAQVFFEDDEVVVIQDILPKAPVHMLVILKEHVVSVAHLENRHQPLVGKMILVAKQVAESKNIAEAGYKLVFNVGKDGGQIVPHIHLHVLGGKQFSE